MTDEATSRPTVKLRPNKGRRLSHGAPWAYSDEVALDRRTRRLTPGTLVQLVDGDRSLGVAAFNGESRIALRLLDNDGDAVIGADWFRARLARAEALRKKLYDEPFYRLAHAEADGLPGVVIDRFGDAVVVQPNAAWAEALKQPIVDAVTAVTGAATVVLNATSRARRLEGLDEYLEIAVGALDGPVAVRMNGATYMADLAGGQKTGLYYDQRPNHAFAARLARGGRVLDLFSHVGGFSLAALAGGAASALAVDSSTPALELAARGAEATGVADHFEVRKSEVFEALAALSEERFDVVVSDPPAFAPSKQALANGLRAYQKLARMAAPLVRPGGFLVLCSCSHAAEVEAFHRANAAGLEQAGRTGALIHSGRAGPDHPVHAALPETSYLKALVYRLDG